MVAADKLYDGIEGLGSRDPIGAVLRVGGSRTEAFASGYNRAEKYAFQVVNFKANDDRVRERHPRFDRFNKANIAARQDLEVMLIHATVERAYNVHLTLYRTKELRSPPNGAPVCTGDGRRATRWIEGEGYRDIECLNERCIYRKRGRRELCKPSVTLVFQPVWPRTVVVSGAEKPHPWNGLPTPMMLFESGSWNTATAFQGLWDHIDSQYEQLGVPVGSRTIFGLRIMLSVRKESKDKRVYPVVRPSIVTPDFQAHVLAMARQRGELASAAQDLAAGLPVLPSVRHAHTPEARSQRQRALNPTIQEATPPRQRPEPVDDWADPNDPSDPRPRRPQ